MVLDLLPFKTPQGPRRNWGFVRYIAFGAALAYVGALFLLHVPELEQVMWWSFIAGNLAYYAVGIALAYKCRDNRAFCKYVCPVSVFLRLTGRFALFRVRVDSEKCVSCGRCAQVCPMDIRVHAAPDPSECILCLRCVETCPKGALRF